MSWPSLHGKRLLAVIAHPDDESYAMAGTLALCSQHGAQVRVLCMSNGDAGRDRRSLVQSGSALGKLRKQELQNSCRAIGVDTPHYLGFPDGELEFADLEPFVKLHIREFEPQVAITLGLDGAYGHVDHIATTRTLSRAAKKSDLRILHTAFEPGLFEPIYRNIKRWRPTLINPNLRRSQLGCPRADTALKVPIKSVREIKLGSIAAHISQLEAGDPMSFLMPGLIEMLLDEERFTLAQGPALPPNAVHPFEGLA